MVKSELEIKVKKVSPDAVIPEYATEQSAGFDLVATKDVLVYPQRTEIIPTGLAVEIPKGYALFIYPRSGVSLKTTLRLANSVGVIDSDYRGEIGVEMSNALYSDRHLAFELINTKGEKFTEYAYGCVPMGTVFIKKGDRIAQAVLQKVEKATFKEVAELTPTERGEGGYGSTGK